MTGALRGTGGTGLEFGTGDGGGGGFFAGNNSGAGGGCRSNFAVTGVAGTVFDPAINRLATVNFPAGSGTCPTAPAAITASPRFTG